MTTLTRVRDYLGQHPGSTALRIAEGVEANLHGVRAALGQLRAKGEADYHMVRTAKALVSVWMLAGAEIPEIKPQGHAHHWLIETPSGPVCHAICKTCGAERDYQTVYEPDFGPRNGDTQAQLARVQSFHRKGWQE